MSTGSDQITLYIHVSMCELCIYPFFLLCTLFYKYYFTYCTHKKSISFMKFFHLPLFSLSAGYVIPSEEVLEGLSLKENQQQIKATVHDGNGNIQPC